MTKEIDVNIAAMIVSDLRKKEAAALTELNKIRAALAVYDGGSSTPATGTVLTRKRKRRTLTPEQIAKMQAGRRAANGNGSGTDTTNEAAPETAAPQESHPRLPKGPKTASLAEAAE
jgi:hypothetical protein